MKDGGKPATSTSNSNRFLFFFARSLQKVNSSRKVECLPRNRADLWSDGIFSLQIDRFQLNPLLLLSTFSAANQFLSLSLVSYSKNERAPPQVVIPPPPSLSDIKTRALQVNRFYPPVLISKSIWKIKYTRGVEKSAQVRVISQARIQ